MHKKRKLYASVVGLGVGERHLSFLEKNKNIEVVSIFDPDIKKLKKISKKYNIKSVNSFKKVILKKKQIWLLWHLQIISIPGKLLIA